MFVYNTIKKKGSGLLNSLIDKLPIELHIPGYNYCGPGTKLEKRLSRGDKGINLLDTACLEHDIQYSQFKDLQHRQEADRELAEKAYQRFKATDSSIGEKIASLGVAGAMKVKSKLGMGMRIKKKPSKRKKGGALSFSDAVQRARRGIRKNPSSDLLQMSKNAVSSIGTKKLSPPKKRIIPIPKSGGFLPLIPLFAALGALGSIGGGAAGIAKAVNDAKAAREQLEEQKRHNIQMEEMEHKNVGKGLYLRPYKKGMGLYLAPYKKNSQ